MPSRKHHTKSRHGCDTCKKSKVRCDLERPICKRCARLDRPCSFAEDEGMPVRRLPERPSRSSKSKSSPKPAEALSQSAIKDLDLMHHYSTLTCFTMADNEINLRIWQFEIPRHAFAHEFLLHGLLALSALHNRHSCDQSERRALADLAAGHQQAALSTYIPLLQGIDEKNCHALFAFSSILGAISFAFLQYPEEEPTSAELVTNIIDIFDLLIGATVIAVEGRQWLRSGSLAPLMDSNLFADMNPMDCDRDLRASLDAVLHKATPIHSPSSQTIGLSPPETSRYGSSVELLTSLFSYQQAAGVSMGEMIGWPVFVGSSYLSLLKSHDPKALVILAHYGAALHVNGGVWYLQNLGKRLVRAVFDLLDSEWKPFMGWPLGRTSV